MCRVIVNLCGTNFVASFLFNQKLKKHVRYKKTNYPEIVHCSVISYYHLTSIQSISMFFVGIENLVRTEVFDGIHIVFNAY